MLPSHFSKFIYYFSVFTVWLSGVLIIFIFCFVVFNSRGIVKWCLDSMEGGGPDFLDTYLNYLKVTTKSLKYREKVFVIFISGFVFTTIIRYLLRLLVVVSRYVVRLVLSDRFNKLFWWSKLAASLIKFCKFLKSRYKNDLDPMFYSVYKVFSKYKEIKVFISALVVTFFEVVLLILFMLYYSYISLKSVGVINSITISMVIHPIIKPLCILLIICLVLSSPLLILFVKFLLSSFLEDVAASYRDRVYMWSGYKRFFILIIISCLVVYFISKVAKVVFV